ncbi:hypothetical protein V1292_004147 [Bradyrhizobium sp. AZCC 1719]|uniref:caspase family protein n=1 Tax=Bradyrhizobium sp. AZCC 1719 TaxID=3117028 RepID=UPI002FF27CF1
MVERGKSYEGYPPPISSAAAERRVALVIGNSDYLIAPLKNPRNDAELFATKLKSGSPPFDVTLALDVGRDAMEGALEEFERELVSCDTALLFYAGHGLQVSGTNYLIPVDADIRQEVHLRRRAFSLNEVLDLMRHVRTSSLVFLDACRDNPFARSLLMAQTDHEQSRSLTRSGLAKVHQSRGSFIAFATAPDNIARDGSGKNSPFTAALANHMTTPGLSINDLMIAVRKDVLKATNGSQEPWDQSSLRENFRFCELPANNPAIALANTSGRTPGSDEALLDRLALEYWEAVKGTTDPRRLREFLADFGTTRLGRLAREALQLLATKNWEKVQKQNENDLDEFIKAYPGTDEIVEANILLNMVRAEQDALAASQDHGPELNQDDPPPHLELDQDDDPELNLPDPELKQDEPEPNLSLPLFFQQDHFKLNQNRPRIYQAGPDLKIAIAITVLMVGLVTFTVALFTKFF